MNYRKDKRFKDLDYTLTRVCFLVLECLMMLLCLIHIEERRLDHTMRKGLNLILIAKINEYLILRGDKPVNLRYCLHLGWTLCILIESQLGLEQTNQSPTQLPYSNDLK